MQQGLWFSVRVRGCVPKVSSRRASDLGVYIERMLDHKVRGGVDSHSDVRTWRILDRANGESVGDRQADERERGLEGTGRHRHTLLTTPDRAGAEEASRGHLGDED